MVKRFMAPGPWITRDLKPCVLASDYDALRFELSSALEYARQTMPPTEFAEAMALSQDSQTSGGSDAG